MQVCDRPELVEDVLQDLFAYLAENCGKLRKVSNFEVYLFLSVKRNLLSRLSREKQSRQAKERYWQRTAPVKERFAEAPDEQVIAEEELNRRQHVLQGELAKLPDHQREILYLRYFEELSYEEICQILGLSNQVARNYASRAIRKLKEALLNTAWLIGLLMWFR